jgi:hypothetical protein
MALQLHHPYWHHHYRAVDGSFVHRPVGDDFDEAGLRGERGDLADSIIHQTLEHFGALSWTE